MSRKFPIALLLLVILTGLTITHHHEAEENESCSICSIARSITTETVSLASLHLIENATSDSVQKLSSFQVITLYFSRGPPSSLFI